MDILDAITLESSVRPHEADLPGTIFSNRTLEGKLKVAFILALLQYLPSGAVARQMRRRMKAASDIKSRRLQLLDIDGIEPPNIFLRTKRMGSL